LVVLVVVVSASQVTVPVAVTTHAAFANRGIAISVANTATKIVDGNEQPVHATTALALRTPLLRTSFPLVASATLHPSPSISESP